MPDPAADLAEVIAARWVADHLGNLPRPDRDALADIGKGIDGHVPAAVIAAAQRRVPQVLAALQQHLHTLTDLTPTTPEEAHRG